MRKKYFSLVMIFTVFIVSAQTIEENRRAAAEFLLDKYKSVSINPYRGITEEEWNERADIFMEKVNNASSTSEFYLAFRYFSALSYDGHFNFPDMGVYNREKIFRKEDKLFPAIVRATLNDRVFIVRDLSGTIPDYAELLEINGLDVKEISRIQHELVPYETNYAYGHLNEKEEFSFKAWPSFANYLFCEKILDPFRVKYSVGDSIKTVTVNAMERHKLHKHSKAVKRSYSAVPGKVMDYYKKNDSIAVLDINHFWGKNPMTFLFSKTDSRFERLLKKKMKKVTKDNIKFLIIDIRSNAGGYAKNVYELMSYFAPDMIYDDKSVYKISNDAKEDDRGARILDASIEMIHGAKNKDKIEETVKLYKSMPVGTTFRQDTLIPMTYSYYKSPKFSFRGKTYVLTNSTTFSASVMFCNYIRKANVGLIAGKSPGGYSIVTGGARIPINSVINSVIPMKIPHISNNPSDTKDYCYIIPDILIENDLQDWIEVRDKSLDKLVDMIETGLL